MEKPQLRKVNLLLTQSWDPGPRLSPSYTSSPENRESCLKSPPGATSLTTSRVAKPLLHAPDSPLCSWNLGRHMFCFSRFFFPFFSFLKKFFLLLLFFLLYNIVLVLPYFNMHLPWVYTGFHSHETCTDVPIVLGLYQPLRSPIYSF